MGKLGQNDISDDPDEELRKYLDQDDVIEFERKQQLVSSIWQDQDVPQLEEKPRNTVGSVPPVKLHVGKIPQGLKNLPPTPTPSRTVMKTILTMRSKSVLLETLTNLGL